ncbi:DUF1800 domain-containing protein [Virgisporangium ochraceum]|uniref:DUF1800 domain-containing protein n=1 Tax=Virgisporangium ochraceum TaxID=65505 RepID=A0A8J4A0Y0_9ACTN|nr:DUF1800 domain-containing protein [Virgisporangium ochraceum]GIJ72008.1 hypothetical protein Voc01_069250 [Virgisporangium ochraceum]
MRKNVLGRRRVLATAAVAGAGVALVETVAAPAAAQAAPSPVQNVPTAQGALTAQGTVDPLHLLRRATYGRTADSEAELRSLGVTAWLDRQLKPTSIDDAACDAVVARFPLVSLGITAVRNGIRKGAWDAMQQLGTAAVARACWSRRQLFEVMVDFWSNHLNVTCPSSDVWDSRPDYDRTVIRAHALGRFADMLKASAAHPAMLSYLDNRSSTKDKPNENYGRELMELHTVGLVYSEADVKQAALLLTGRTVDATTGLYRYDAAKHATGAVSILGWSHANATAAEGEKASAAFLDHLAMHPKTAERIATKLCVRFVADEPPATLVATLAKVYLDNKTAIAPVLRALFTSAEFATAANAKAKTPMEDIVSSVRILGLGPDATGTDGIRALYQILEKTGHGPMRWEPPNGYPDVAAAWASPSGFVVRWNAHLNLAAGWYPKQLTRKTPLLTQLVPGALPATYGALVETVVKSLIGTAPKPEHTAALTQFFGKKPIDPLKAKDQAVTGKFPHLVALVLDAPMFQVR